jgi:hypothetical protein
MLLIKVKKNCLFEFMKSDQFIVSKKLVIAVIECIQNFSNFKVCFSNELKLKIRNALRNLKACWNRVKTKRLQRKYFLLSCDNENILFNISVACNAKDSDTMMDISENTNDSLCFRFNSLLN